jgi:hypothetical protein
VRTLTHSLTSHHHFLTLSIPSYARYPTYYLSLSLPLPLTGFLSLWRSPEQSNSFLHLSQAFADLTENHYEEEEMRSRQVLRGTLAPLSRSEGVQEGKADLADALAALVRTVSLLRHLLSHVCVCVCVCMCMYVPLLYLRCVSASLCSSLSVSLPPNLCVILAVYCSPAYILCCVVLFSSCPSIVALDPPSNTPCRSVRSPPHRSLISLSLSRTL